MKAPKYRNNSSRNRAFVEWQGKRNYLPGAHGSAESVAAYKQFLAVNVLGASVQLPEHGKQLVVSLLVASFLSHSKRHYKGGDGSRGEYANLRHALTPFVNECGNVLASDFGPVKLENYREHLVKQGHSRGYINSTIGKIKRCFRWGVAKELLPPSSYHALAALPNLQSGRTEAVDKPHRQPVPWESVEPVLAELNPVVADMLRVQWFTGVRPTSLCQARAEQFTKDGDLWLWRPRHKTEFRGKEVILPIGPKCQAILQPYMSSKGYLFDPRKRRKNRRYGERYKTTSYYRAIVRALERVNKQRRKDGLKPIPHWFPYQVRHAKGMATRSQHGAEAAQAVLGHDSLDATEIYTERRLEVAKRIARDFG